MKPEICFINRSTEASFPVFNKVVIAKVATLRFWSVIRFSMSKLQGDTAAGFESDNLLRMRMAANRRVGFGEDKKSCNTSNQRQ
jgi:hypothetical protein